MIPQIELVRLDTAWVYGTLGAMKLNKEVFSWYLEPYDYGNMPRESAILAGQYECIRVDSPLVAKLTGGLITETFEVQHVPGRTNVRWHPGNSIDDTEACFLPGETLGKLKGNRAVLNSGRTFRRFMAELEPYDSFRLTITEAY